MSSLGLGDHNDVGSKEHIPSQTEYFSRRVIRPMRDSDIRSLGRWISLQAWPEVQDAVPTSNKCDAFYTFFQTAIYTHFLTKEVKIHYKDKQRVSPSVKALINQRQILFNTGPKREWRACSNTIIRSIGKEKCHFCHDRVAQLKWDNPTSWHQNIKLMTSRSKCCLTTNVPGCDQSDPSKIVDTINKQFVDVASNIQTL